MVSLLGKLLLYGGFILAAFASVQKADNPLPDKPWLEIINWGLYAGGAVIAFVGIVMLRVSASDAGANAEKVDSDMQTIDDTLQTLVTKVESLNKDRDTIGVYGIHTHIDDNLVEDLDAFVEIRESISHRYGLQKYADLMSQFALAERNLNRAWSASADGYIDETWKCLDNAQHLIHDAQRLFRSYRDRETPA